MNIETEEQLDQKILKTIEVDRQEEANIIEDYKNLYEKITGNNFESATVDNVLGISCQNWWRFLYNGELHDSILYPVDVKKEDLIRANNKFKNTLINASSSYSFIEKTLARTMTIGELIKWLRSPQRLILRPTINVC